jgi:hypothetical protein
MSTTATIRKIACLAALAAFTLPDVALAETPPFYERTANGTWDCRDPGGKFVGTIVLAEETYAFLKTDGSVAGYGKLRLLDADTHLPNFAVISGPLKDEMGSGAVGLTGPREDYEDFSGELFLVVAVSTDRNQSLYCTGRPAPPDLM